MTKDEAIALAKKTIADLGYKLSDVAYDWPMKVWGPGKQGTNMIPFGQNRWAVKSTDRSMVYVC